MYIIPKNGFGFNVVEYRTLVFKINLSFLPLFLVVFLPIWAQVKVSGTIRFKETQEPVRAASIYFANSKFGTTSTKNGTFQYFTQLQAWFYYGKPESVLPIPTNTVTGGKAKKWYHRFEKHPHLDSRILYSYLPEKDDIEKKAKSEMVQTLYNSLVAVSDFYTKKLMNMEKLAFPIFYMLGF